MTPKRGTFDAKMTTQLRKLVAGDEYRRSRLHDEKGNRVPARELAVLPLSVIVAVRYRLTGRLPRRPWIAGSGLRRLSQLLTSESRGIEFGSGCSTAWLADRVAHLQSIEHDREWYERVRPQLPSHVRYDLRDENSYWDVSEHPDGSLDFAFVDGIHRAECVAAVVPKIRRGGWVFLDNTDKDMTTGPDGDLRRAERALSAAVAQRGGTLEQGTGFPLGNLAPTQWQLARFETD